VITSAALIMIVVFGAFAFSRVLMVQFLGFGLALACCRCDAVRWCWCRRSCIWQGAGIVA
jgi:hypothetical protein